MPTTPHIDPSLQWAGKAEHTSFEVPTVSLHVHERIDPRTVIEAARKTPSGSPVNGRESVPRQLSLFELPKENPPIRDAIEFYKHKHNWSNRLIAGNSLLVMNSLMEKEGLSGKVQMIYFDPPYGIKYGSNFQPFVNKRDVKDGKDEDLTQEPEMIKAFRDTWELGIHSYLTYLRDRLLLARELLTESGSVFVQISDENVHLVRCLMDEVFGVGNSVSLISFSKTSGQSTTLIPTVSDYLIWYCKDKEKIKYRQLYIEKEMGQDSLKSYQFVELPNGRRKKLTDEEKGALTKFPKGSKIYRLSDLASQGYTETGWFEYEFDGKKFFPPNNRHWTTTKEGLNRLKSLNRLQISGQRLNYVRYLEDFSVLPIHNLWLDTGSSLGGDKTYVVQTALSAIQRCLLMTTDPGDLVLDPTCVRKGTKILIPLDTLVKGTPLSNPEKRTHISTTPNNTPLNPPVNGGTLSPSPFTGRAGVGFIPVESIQPGDYVYSHDGQPHRVTRTIKRRFQGAMIGIRRALSPEILLADRGSPYPYKDQKTCL